MSAPRIRFTRNVVHTEKQQVARFIIGAAVLLNPLTATIAGDEGDAVLTASVYIPESQESWFTQKLDENAATVDEDRPRHQRLIESVERIRRATDRLPAAGRS